MNGKKIVTIDSMGFPGVNTKAVSECYRTVPGSFESLTFSSMKQDDPIELVAAEMGLVTAGGSSLDMDTLAARINEWIQNDFQKLISVLYRMDVSEPKLRSLLQHNPGSDAGKLIAELMIERQVEKIKSRQQFRQRDNDIDEEEKW